MEAAVAVAAEEYAVAVEDALTAVAERATDVGVVAAENAVEEAAVEDTRAREA